MKRHLFKLVVFLMLGAIVNVAVAWGCAALLIGRTEPEMEYIEALDGSADREPWIVIHAWGFEYVAVTFDVEAVVGSVLGRMFTTSDPQARPQLDWSTMRSGSLKEARGLFDAGVFAEAGAGWPLRCLGYRVRALEPDDADSAIAYDWGLPFDRGLNEPFDYPGKLLPLRPIWPGFAINTVFYAAILWLLTFGTFAVRRFVRNKRGHCIKCGYDLRGDSGGVCPECGVAA